MEPKTFLAAQVGQEGCLAAGAGSADRCGTGCRPLHPFSLGLCRAAAAWQSLVLLEIEGAGRGQAGGGGAAPSQSHVQP